MCICVCNVRTSVRERACTWAIRITITVWGGLGDRGTLIENGALDDR
jgi:hypothetical protein